MIIYRCIISSDEMFSDIYKISTSASGLFYEVEGKMVTRTEQFDEALIGANASAEETCEGTENSSVSGCDIILNHNLQETGFNKKSYMGYLKDYVKNLKSKLEESNPGRVEEFQESCKKEVKKLIENIANYQFFTGESMNPEGMVGLLNFREDGITPYMIFFKDGLVEEKC